MKHVQAKASKFYAACTESDRNEMKTISAPLYKPLEKAPPALVKRLETTRGSKNATKNIPLIR